MLKQRVYLRPRSTESRTHKSSPSKSERPRLEGDRIISPRERRYKEKLQAYAARGEDFRIGSLAAALSGRYNPEVMRDELCRRHLADFLQRVFYTLVPNIQFVSNWHIDLVCEYLEAVRAGEIKRLIINMPPRFLKSFMCSVAFPAWLLGHDPTSRILCGSYAYDLAVDLSVKTRRVMQAEWYTRMFPKTDFAPDQNEKSKFETSAHGFRNSVSVGGSVTGMGGMYKILDDPIDPEGAYSEAERKAVLRWLDETWSSRTDSPKETREIVVMQRVHVQDPTGHLMAQGGWELLKLPQEAPVTVKIKFPKSGREITRKRNEVLCEAYQGVADVAALKKRFGMYGYAAQQQQEPVPVGGGRIKVDWFPRFDVLPGKVEETIASLDTGYKKGNSNPTALGIFQRVGEQWFLVRILKDRWTYPELCQAVEGVESAFKPDTWLIEDKASGISLIQDMKAGKIKVKGGVLGIEPEADKVTRMEVQLSQLASGRVALPTAERHELWEFEFSQNLSSYPSPKEWDEIDMTSQFLKWLRSRTDAEPEVTVVPYSATGSSGWRV